MLPTAPSPRVRLIEDPRLATVGGSPVVHRFRLAKVRVERRGLGATPMRVSKPA